MLINDFEKAIIGLIVKHPETPTVKRIVKELRNNRFSSEPHRLIYSAIEDLVMANQVPNTITVAAQLGLNLESCGGIEYLASLVQVPSLLQTHDSNGWELWVKRIELAGQLNHLKSLNTKLSSKLDNIDQLVLEVENIHDLTSDFGREINSAITPKSGYKHISEYIDITLDNVACSKQGVIEDVISCSIPSLIKYQIPRPKSLGGILGMPSTGKTSLAVQMLLGTAYQLMRSGERGRVYFHSLDTPGERIPTIIGCMLARIDSMVVAHRTWTEEQKSRFVEALKWARALPLSMNDELLTSTEMKALAIVSSFDSPRVLSISDYAEKFTDRDRESEERRLNKIVRNHREVAWSTGSCEILLSQVGPDAIRSPYKLATWTDAKFNKGMENDLDWGLVIWNPIAMRARSIRFEVPKGRREDLATIFIQKNKGYAPGEEYFEWIPSWSSFKDLSLPRNHLWMNEPWQIVEAEW